MQHQESQTPPRLVIGLFYSSGIAEDAVHRLITEGVSPRDIAHRVLKQVGPVPPTSVPELAALDVDPLVIGNARETFVRYIRNGETAVFVRALNDEQVEFASEVIKQYVPITIEVFLLPERPAEPGR
jgi:hypothetical protein